MRNQDKILITGASGLIGRSLVRLLKENGYHNLYTPRFDVRNAGMVNTVFSEERPDYVFHLAAKVGGIQSNSDYPAEFIYDNTVMHCNIFAACHNYKVKKVLFPGSACAYPRDALQPIKPQDFLNGYIEPTNIAYAAAKINGIAMAQAYAKQYGMNVVIPMIANTYGDGDHSSHVIPELISRISDAKLIGKWTVDLWGSGAPLREFIYADDVASALLLLMESHDSSDIINVGTQKEISIYDLARLIIEVIGYKGGINFDKSKPDGAPRKVLDSSVIRAMGWFPKVSLREGIIRMIGS